MKKKELEGVSVLVAEDDPGIRSLLCNLLESYGARVYLEEHGRDLIKRVKEQRPDILVLDIVMPIVDGFTILNRLRQEGDKTPVIVLSDRKTVEEKVKGLDSGADDYMTKPFSTKEFLARVKSVLRRVGEMDKDGERVEVVIGSTTINLLSREIYLKNGDRLLLTRTEFDLLSYLAVRVDRVVPRGDLLCDVLGYKTKVETKALVMHIANIRRKMAQVALEDVKIETVSGVGYKVVEKNT
ncbi:response regulator transcription factor [Desulforhopalus singaporensis]|uniref:Two-component system, OmpR family, response regulator MprA n=1 Tax=Desulforhopalus singaporensis TaxID=91360 RepID=A0A1H0JCV0_9BACT|nr:response regulator transcription factor [Desulforhopalus singaporensis]SDO41181.1 two-component system, OmpR family, response regulator MprA [Desulforhopalus singaporensis]